MLDLIAQLQTRERTGAGCVAENGFCPDWIADNWDRYVDPFFEHVILTLAPVTAGFAISFTVALLAHRRRWLITPYASITGALYTIPSIAFLFLLQPVTGRGFLTAFVALTCYTLLIIFRNVMTGLESVPAEAKDAARGMGLFRAGAGGLGSELIEQRFFKSNIAVAGGLCVLLAAAFDVVVLIAQRLATPWRSATA